MFQVASPSVPRKDVTRESCTSDMHKKANAVRAGFKRPALWVLVFGWSLAVCAGFVNTVSFRCWGLYVSHMTGASAAVGMRIEGFQQNEHSFDTLGEAMWLVFSFVVGAYLCGLLIDKNQVHFLGKAFYGVALVGNALLLVGAAFTPDRMVSACFASTACGLQNAMCTSHFGAVVRTTHVTGTVTDIGSTLGRMSMIFMRNGCRRSRLNILESAEVGVDARKLLVLLPMWISFVFGCIAGAYVENGLKQLAFLVPAAVTFVVGTAYMLFRKMLKDFVKGLEKARLNDDLRHIQEALAHHQERLHSLPPSATQSSQEEDFVVELDEEVGHIMEALHDLEAEVEHLCSSSISTPKRHRETARDCPPVHV